MNAMQVPIYNISKTLKHAKINFFRRQFHLCIPKILFSQKQDEWTNSRLGDDKQGVMQKHQ